MFPVSNVLKPRLQGLRLNLKHQWCINMTKRYVTVAIIAGMLLVPAFPHAAEAQRTRVRITSRSIERVPDRDITLAVGVLDYDRGTDDLAPMASLRAEWGLRRWVRSELAFSYALADVPRPDLGVGETARAQLAGASLGVKAELPTRVIRPYVGIAAGLFGRFDSDDGDEFVRPSLSVPAGVRIRLGSASLRLETRWRFDEHRDGVSSPSREFTAGLGFRY